MTTPHHQAALHREGRLELAIQAYRKGEVRGYVKAAAAYDVARNTL